MAFRISSAPALAVVLLAGCSTTPGTLTQALDACARGAAYTEMRDSGVVIRVLGERQSRSGVHEGFLVGIPDRRRVLLVEDNVDITGEIPLRSGDRIDLQGQFECNDDVIHWTHRDPSGRHVTGYITVNGKTYQ